MLNLAQKKIIKVHFCFQKQDGRDMNTEKMLCLILEVFVIDQMIIFEKDEKVNIRLNSDIFEFFVDFIDFVDFKVFNCISF